MNIQLYLLIAIIVFGFYYRERGDTYNNRRAYIFIILTLLTLESCLRGLSVGSDTTNYYWMFNNSQYMSWNQVWSDFLSKYIHARTADSPDVGFMILNKVIYAVFPNFSFSLFISALTFFIPLGMLLNRYLTNLQQLTFAFILYVCLFNPIAMSGVRKEIALGTTILAFIFYVDKKYWPMVISLLLGTTIHITTLLFLGYLAIDLVNKKFLRTMHVGAFALIPVALAFSGPIIVFMADAIDSEHYAQYGMGEVRGGTETFLIMLEACSLLCLYAFRKVDFLCEKIIGHLYAMIPLFTFFGVLIYNNGSMIRISQYFHVYLLVLLPYAFEYGFKSNAKTVYFLAEMILVGLMLWSGGRTYYFIWNDFIPT